MTQSKLDIMFLHALRGLLIMIACLLLLYPPDLNASAKVVATRLSDNHSHIRLVLESDQLIDYQLLKLDSPSHHILRLSNVAGFDNYQQLLGLSKNEAFAFRLKINSAPDDSSHVLEIESKFTQAPKLFMLKPQEPFAYRLVIDFPYTQTASLQQEHTHPETSSSKAGVLTAAKAKSSPPNPVNVRLTDTAGFRDDQSPAPVRAWYASLDSETVQSPHTSRALNRAWAEIWLDVTLNQQFKGTQLLLINRRGQIAITQSLLDAWHIQFSDNARDTYQGEWIYILNAVDGLKYDFNEPQQSISISAPPPYFELNQPQLSAQTFHQPTPAALGLFLNYDLALNHAQSRFRFNSLYEAGLSTSAGVGIGTFLLNHSDDETNFTRLDSTWTLDLPQRVSSLRLGDVISSPSNWGRSVRLGGLQWATNFATQPQFVRYPLPSFLGETALPSTLDLYVNQALVAQNEVSSGPFVLNELPVVSGSGQAQIVIRDILGRENIVSLPYYISTQLLRPGLNDFSFELGAIRQNYATRSNDYGELAGAASFRRGIVENFSIDAHSEFSEGLFNLGLSSVWLPAQVGVVNFTLAGSEGERGSGALAGVGFERQSARFSFGANSQWRSRKFNQLGLEQDQLPPIQTSQAFASISLTPASSLNLNYAIQRHRDRDSQELIGVSLNQNIAGFGFLNLSALHFLRGESDTLISLSFTFSLDRRTSASLSANHQNGHADALLQIQRSLPPGPGFGYRAAIGTAQDGRLELGLSQQTNYGTYRVDYSHLNNQDSVRALASGALVLVDGDVFASRRINDAYAVVKVADYPGVRVYAENQLVGETNDSGKALIPQLRAYEKNQIRIESADLPLSAQMDGANMLSSPYFRSASIVEFPVQHSQGATLTLLQENGMPVPAGATAQLNDQSEVFPVGLAGYLFLNHLGQNHRIEVKWPGHRCQFQINSIDSRDPLPDLGTHTCKEAMP